MSRRLARPLAVAQAPAPPALAYAHGHLGQVLAVTNALDRARHPAPGVAAPQRMAGGDLAEPALPHGADKVGQLQAAIEDMKHRLARVVGDVRERLRNVATSMAEVASGRTEALVQAVGPFRLA